MPRMICLETGDGEVFVNLDQVCQANVAPDAIHLQLSGGEMQIFSGTAAHGLLMALRHEERRTAQER
jgi:hypothetical protein